MTVEYEPRARDIAVIGMSGRFPGARDLDTFWQNLAQGRDGVTFFSDEEVAAAGVPPEEFRQPNYVKAGMVLDGVEEFDAAFFGYNPKEAEMLDPQQRLFLEHAWEAIEHAGYSPQRYQQLIGIYAGIAWNTYLLSNLTAHADLFDSSNVFQTFITNDKDFMATRLSYKLNLKGPSIVVQTSCSTSLVAVHLACLGLLVYDCDMALAGGVTVKVPQKSGYMYLEGGLASPDGHCRSFDANAQGTIFGSGIGVVVLKRMADAIEDGDTIYAVIRGSAINNDGAMKVSYTAPSVEGQAEVIAAAQSAADVEAETISYIETHGTGTALGDPIEVAALTKVFREQTQKRQFCGIGSVKSNIGHLDAAAGIAGLLKTVLSLKHGQIPPSLHFTTPNPKMDLANSPFYVNTRLADWSRGDVPRRAAVSSFGVGGTNAHVIIEEAPLLEASGPSHPWHVLQLSAKTATALDRATENLAAYLRQHAEVPLADIAYTLQAGRTVFQHRRMVVCQSHEDAAQALETLNPQRVWSDVDTQDPRDRPVVFMFPGQGSQYMGMGEALYRQEPVFRRSIDECAALLKPYLGADIRTLLYPGVMHSGGPAATHGHPPTTADGALLEQTQYAQPALFVIEYALAQLWLSWGVKPQAMIGHSIGEYVAACLAGVFSLQDALALVATRGRLMQTLPQGGMLSVALPEHELRPLIEPELSIAAINAPSASVVAGPRPAIAAFEERLTALGISYRSLHTSHAFHSAMMEPIMATFAAAVAQVTRQEPAIPYISNVTGAWIQPEEATSPQYWARHLRETVRFAQGIDTLLGSEDSPSERVLLEVGPGTTLSSLARQQYPALALASLRHPHDQRDDLEVILAVRGKLWLVGLDIDCNNFDGQQRRRVPLPTYPFERQRYWIAAQPRQAARSRRAELGKQADLADWFYLPSWQHTPPLKPLRAEDLAQRVQTWLLLIEPDGIGAALVERLADLGQRVVTVEAGAAFARQAARQYTIAAGQPGDYDLLLSELQRDGLFPQAIVHGWSMANDGGDLRTAQEQGFFSLLFLTQSLGRQVETGDLRIGILTSSMQHVAGEPSLAPQQAPILGLSKVIPQEYPQISCRSIDLVPPTRLPRPDLLDQWIAEIIADDPQSVVAYRDRQRWVATYQPVRLEQDAAPLYPLHPHGVYVISGGLAGLGLMLARSLAQTLNARLALVEDVALPARDTWDSWLAAHEPSDSTSSKIQRVRELERHGAQVLPLHIDYARPEQWRAALDRTRQEFGTIHGLIHAAGAEGEQSFQAIQDVDRSACDSHFGTKVSGVAALAEALRDESLDFCCLASSLSAVLGGRGSAAYTAANCFMDMVVHPQNHLGRTRWISVDWDVWASEEQNQIAAFSTELARLAMSQAEVGEVFTRIVTGNLTHVVVSTADLAGRLDEWRVRLQAMRDQVQHDPGVPTARHPRPQLQTMYVAPSTDLEQSIATVWQRVLGFEEIGVDDNFFDLGGDSLIAIRMVNQLKQELGLDISVVKLYQAVTIRALVAVLEQSEQQSMQRSIELQERREEMQRRKQYQQLRRARKEH